MPKLPPEPTLETITQSIRRSRCGTKGSTMTFLSSLGCKLSTLGLRNLNCLSGDRQVKVFHSNFVDMFYYFFVINFSVCTSTVDNA